MKQLTEQIYGANVASTLTSIHAFVVSYDDSLKKVSWSAVHLCWPFLRMVYIVNAVDGYVEILPKGQVITQCGFCPS